MRAQDLTKHFAVRREPGSGKVLRGGAVLHAVDGVSFTLGTGQTLGLVGESGCGKSTVGRLVAGLERPTSGYVEWPLMETEGRDSGGRVQMVFQDPVSSLDPRKRVSRSLAEPIAGLRLEDQDERVVSALESVGLPPGVADRYPRELSGGQAQRVCVARALIGKPRVVVLDEAVSALDISTQVEILDRLLELQAVSGCAFLFISHDLKAIRALSDEIAVMYLGRLVELQSAQSDYFLHPYSVALEEAAPRLDGRRGPSIVLEGDLPSAVELGGGCRFAGRCPCVQDRCRVEEPQLQPNGGGGWVACHFPGSLK